MNSNQVGLIALDWGTSNCRAFRFGADSQAIECRSVPHGILAVKDGDFAGAFGRLVGGWLSAYPHAPVLMSGMIGSRQGWVEAPYVPLPATPQDVAAHLTPVPVAGRTVRIVPGLVGGAFAGGHDVMRGEETQVIGALALGDGRNGIFCLPGTHSKWVEVADGRIIRFATFMTGEVYAVLRQHSILGRLMEGEAHDAGIFAAGLERSARDGGLLHQLFAVRTEGLFGEIAPAGLASFLSGVLIGHEIRAARAILGPGRVTLVGAPELTRRYALALERETIATAAFAGDLAAAHGLWLIAKEAGLSALRDGVNPA